MDGVGPSSRLDVLLRDIDLPPSAYERAERRYEDLGQWLARPASTIRQHDAHVFVQGSFALGTAIRPVNAHEEYDLDFTCKLRAGVSRDTHTQAQLKELIRVELEIYRRARQIENQLEPKHRCWRLGYQDELPFHMDVVPGIKAGEARRGYLAERMIGEGIESGLAANIARRALWITDDRRADFDSLGSEWPSSNPGGFQAWFLSRLRPPTGGILLEKAQVDSMPVFRALEPLQRVVQLLKRHRDVMFADQSDLKPASILITTIAGRASRYGEGLELTLRRALAELRVVRESGTFEIKNPINPDENFADRWTGVTCPLRINFHAWVDAVQVAFSAYLTETVPQRLVEVASDDFGVHMSGESARSLTGAAVSISPARRVEVEDTAPPPWRY